jgi:hypothetical protein
MKLQISDLVAHRMYYGGSEPGESVSYHKVAQTENHGRSSNKTKMGERKAVPVDQMNLDVVAISNYQLSSMHVLA